MHARTQAHQIFHLPVHSPYGLEALQAEQSQDFRIASESLGDDFCKLRIIVRQWPDPKKQNDLFFQRLINYFELCTLTYHISYSVLKTGPGERKK